MKVKIFVDSSWTLLEQTVNEWLEENELTIARVVRILQSESAGTAHTGQPWWRMTITVVYE